MAATEGQIIPASAELLQRYDTLFGISKNVARAIPNVRDGLKPVQRKILYIMNSVARDEFKKVGTIIGEVLKIYSHGDASVTDALIRMGATWANIIPYIVGKGNYGCHDDLTEVLTDRGWVLWRNVTEDMKLATVDPKTYQMTLEKPIQIFRYVSAEDKPFTMYTTKKTCPLNFSVTEDHKMLYGKAFARIKTLKKPRRIYTGVSIDWSKMEKPDSKISATHYALENIMSLVGLYFHLGSIVHEMTRDGNEKLFVRFKKTNSCSDTLHHYITAAKQMLGDQESLNFISDESGYVVDCDPLIKFLKEYNLIDVSREDRIVPMDIARYGRDAVRRFMCGYVFGADVSYQQSGRLYVINRKNVDTLQMLGFLIGRSYIVSPIPQSKARCYGPYTIIMWRLNTVCSLKPDDLEISEYHGTVHCAMMPSYHTLVTRRNGCILISGNSVMGDAPAAARYIEAMLSPFARQCFFTDKLCIDMVPTYDNTRMEPEVLPSMFPTAIINGCAGSGWGQSSNICQYNVKDVLEKTLELIDDPNAPGYLIPDSHWGCDISNSKVTGKYKNSFENIYETGYGCYVQSFRYQIDHQRNVVIVTALPAKILLEDVLKEIERLQNENKAFPELKSMVDLSGKDHNDGVWVEFALYEGKNPYRFITKLMSVKDMRKTVKVNIDLVDGLDVIHYSVRGYILAWYHYRHDYIRAVTATQLTAVDSDIAINDIKLFIFGEDRMDRTVEIYRSSVDKNDIIRRLMNEYSKSTGMTSQQAAVLAEMSGKDYTKSALEKYKSLKVSLQAEHDRLEKIITSKDGINNIIKDQLRSGLKYARPRGAKIIGRSKELESDTVVLAINPKTSSIIKLPDNETSQKLVSSLPSSLCLSMDSSYNAIVFDTNGRYVIINPGEIPMMKSLDQMVPINRYIDKQLGTLIAMECQDEGCKNFMVLTKFGKVKKIDPSKYKGNTKNNTYIGLDEGDSVVSVVGIKNEKTHIIAYTDNGSGQRFPANIISITSASAQGTYGMTIPDGETLVGGFCVTDADLIVYITRKGMIRANHSRYFLARKNKKDWIHLIEIKQPDELVTVVTCSAHDTLRVVYSDFSTKDIPVNSIPVDTMNSPMRNMLYQPHKRVLNVKRITKKKPK